MPDTSAIRITQLQLEIPVMQVITVLFWLQALRVLLKLHVRLEHISRLRKPLHSLIAVHVQVVNNVQLVLLLCKTVPLGIIVLGSVFLMIHFFRI